MKRADAELPPPPTPDTRCRHCGKRYEDHGLMSRHCFAGGRVMRTTFEAEGALPPR